jgi:hypothetical protein
MQCGCPKNMLSVKFSCDLLLQILTAAWLLPSGCGHQCINMGRCIEQITQAYDQFLLSIHEFSPHQ